MITTRRGFLGALLAAPIAAKLLPEAAAPTLAPEVVCGVDWGFQPAMSFPTMITGIRAMGDKLYVFTTDSTYQILPCQEYIDYWGQKKGPSS